MSDQLLDVRDVCRLLKISPRTVWQWKARGLLPFVQLGRLVRFRSEDLRGFVEKHVNGGGQGDGNGTT